MKAKLISDQEQQTYVLVFQTGDEVVEQLTNFAREHGLSGASITGIGAFSDVVLGYFQFDKKDYKQIPVNEQVEALSLVGNIALADGEPRLHAHVVVGRSDGTALGGHLFEAHVRPTLELFVVESPTQLQRKMNESSSLPLIDLETD